jgi:hypothetical protein
MAHFAHIENGVVQQVIVVSNDDAADLYPQSEPLGQAFIASLGLPGEWRQTSYHGTFRAHYAGIGFTYDATNDVFYAPQPFPSWTLDTNWRWQPPVPYPTDGGMYLWNETTTSWEQING